MFIVECLLRVFFSISDLLVFGIKTFGACFRICRVHRRKRLSVSDDEDVEEYSTYLATLNKASYENKRGELCYICLDYIRCTSGTKLLSCTHNGRFHLACIWKWVKTKSADDLRDFGVINVSCPICRKVDTAQVCNVPLRNRHRSLRLRTANYDEVYVT